MATLLDSFVVRYGAKVTATGFKALNSDIGNVVSNLTGLEDQINAVADKINGVANAMIKLGIGAGFTIFGATTAYAPVETNLNKIIALVGLSREEVEGFREETERMATEYGTSLREVTGAMYDILSAGLRGEDATIALEASLKASAAGLGEIKDLAKRATSVVNKISAELRP